MVIDADANPGALVVPDLPLCIPENDEHLVQIHFTSHHLSTTRPPIVKMTDADRPFRHLQPLKPNLTQEGGYEVYATLVHLRLLPTNANHIRPTPRHSWLASTFVAGMTSIAYGKGHRQHLPQSLLILFTSSQHVAFAHRHPISLHHLQGVFSQAVLRISNRLCWQHRSMAGVSRQRGKHTCPNRGMAVRVEKGKSVCV